MTPHDLKAIDAMRMAIAAREAWLREQIVMLLRQRPDVGIRAITDHCMAQGPGKAITVHQVRVVLGRLERDGLVSGETRTEGHTLRRYWRLAR